MAYAPLQGQTAVVTGGGRGIGRAICLLFAAAGARIVVVARSPDQVARTVAAVEAGGGGAVGLTGDVGDEAVWAGIAALVADRFWRWDVLINAAGVTGPMAPLAEMPLPAWNEMLRINLTGTMLGCRTALAAMQPAGRGIIVNVASGLARRVQPGLAAYSAGKAALVQMSAVLAAETAASGLQAFAIHPGIVETEMVRDQIVRSSADAGAIGSRLASLNLLSPEFSATAFLLLASGRCRDLSGTFVQFDDPGIRERTRALLGEAGLEQWLQGDFSSAAR